MEKKRLIGAEVRVISNLCRRELDNSLTAKNFQRLTGLQGRIVGYLYHNAGNDVFQRDVEKEFKIRRSTATAILKTMEKNGFIKKEPIAGDARMKKLIITEKAVLDFETVDGEIQKIEARMLEGVPDEQRELFFEVMEKIKTNLIRGEEEK